MHYYMDTVGNRADKAPGLMELMFRQGDSDNTSVKKPDNFRGKQQLDVKGTIGRCDKAWQGGIYFRWPGKA